MVREIHIEFNIFGETSIIIDGEELKNVSSFTLEIKEGKAFYSTNCDIFKEEEKKDFYQEMLKNTKIRTIQEAFYEIKKLDPKTRISENSIRNNVKAGNIPSTKEGNVYFVDILNVLEYYRNNYDEDIGKVEKRMKNQERTLQKVPY